MVGWCVNVGRNGPHHRLDHRAQTASGRGALTQKKVVACPPGTEVLEFGAAVQQQALWCGMARAQEVFVVVDGALWLWSLIEDPAVWTFATPPNGVRSADIAVQAAAV